MKLPIIKRITQYAALAMLAMYVFSLGGYYIAFGVMQFQAKQAMHHLIEQSADYKQLGLKKISFAKNDADKVNDAEEEFVYQGKQYDLVYSKTSADSITLYCIWDQNEEAVVNAFHQYQMSTGTTQQSDQQKTVVNIIKLLNHPAIISGLCFDIQTTHSIVTTPYFSAYKSLYKITAIKQPPRIC